MAKFPSELSGPVFDKNDAHTNISKGNEKIRFATNYFKNPDKESLVKMKKLLLRYIFDWSIKNVTMLSIKRLA